MKNRQRQVGMMRKCVHCTSSLCTVGTRWTCPPPVLPHSAGGVLGLFPRQLPAGSPTIPHPTAFFLPYSLRGDRMSLALEKSIAASTSSCVPGSLIPQECSQRANNGRFTLRDLLMVPMQRVLKYHLLLQVHKWGPLGPLKMGLTYLPPCVIGEGVELASGEWAPGPSGRGRWGSRREEELVVQAYLEDPPPQEGRAGQGDVCLCGLYRSW